MMTFTRVNGRASASSGPLYKSGLWWRKGHHFCAL